MIDKKRGGRGNWAGMYARHVLDVSVEERRRLDSSAKQAQSKRPGAARKFAGHAFLGRVLAAFSIELALKAFAIQDHGNHQRGHNLTTLFKDLEPETQKRIENLSPSLKDTLERYQNLFDNLRYEFEEQGKPTSTDLDELYTAAETLIDEYENAHPYMALYQ